MDPLEAKARALELELELEQDDEDAPTGGLELAQPSFAGQVWNEVTEIPGEMYGAAKYVGNAFSRGAQEGVLPGPWSGFEMMGRDFAELPLEQKARTVLGLVPGGGAVGQLAADAGKELGQMWRGEEVNVDPAQRQQALAQDVAYGLLPGAGYVAGKTAKTTSGALAKAANYADDSSWIPAVIKDRPILGSNRRNAYNASEFAQRDGATAAYFNGGNGTTSAARQAIVDARDPGFNGTSYEQTLMENPQLFEGIDTKTRGVRQNAIPEFNERLEQFKQVAMDARKAIVEQAHNSLPPQAQTLKYGDLNLKGLEEVVGRQKLMNAGDSSKSSANASLTELWDNLNATAQQPGSKPFTLDQAQVYIEEINGELRSLAAYDDAVVASGTMDRAAYHKMKAQTSDLQQIKGALRDAIADKIETAISAQSGPEEGLAARNTYLKANQDFGMASEYQSLAIPAMDQSTAAGAPGNPNGLGNAVREGAAFNPMRPLSSVRMNMSVNPADAIRMQRLEQAVSRDPQMIFDLQKAAQYRQSPLLPRNFKAIKGNPEKMAIAGFALAEAGMLMTPEEFMMMPEENQKILLKQALGAGMQIFEPTSDGIASLFDGKITNPAEIPGYQAKVREDITLDNNQKAKILNDSERGVYTPRPGASEKAAYTEKQSAPQQDWDGLMGSIDSVSGMSSPAAPSAMSGPTTELDKMLQQMNETMAGKSFH